MSKLAEVKERTRCAGIVRRYRDELDFAIKNMNANAEVLIARRVIARCDKMIQEIERSRKPLAPSIGSEFSPEEIDHAHIVIDILKKDQRNPFLEDEI